MNDIRLTVLAAGDGVAPLRTTPLGAGRRAAAGSHAAGSIKRPRPDAVFASGIWPLATASVMWPGDTNIRNQHTDMTRVYAKREGGSGPQPLRKQPA